MVLVDAFAHGNGARYVDAVGLGGAEIAEQCLDSMPFGIGVTLENNQCRVCQARDRAIFARYGRYAHGESQFFGLIEV